LTALIITSPQSNLRRARCKGPTGYNGMPQIHLQNCPFPFDNHHPHLIHQSLDRLLSPSQMASRSNQPFCHSSLLRTDRWATRMFCTISALLDMLIKRDMLIIITIIITDSKSLQQQLTSQISTRNPAEARMADRTVSPGYLHLSRTIIVAKTTSGFHTVRQYAHGLLLESQFLPSSTDCLAVRAKIRQKRPSLWP